MWEVSRISVWHRVCFEDGLRTVYDFYMVKVHCEVLHGVGAKRYPLAFGVTFVMESSKECHLVDLCLFLEDDGFIHGVGIHISFTDIANIMKAAKKFLGGFVVVY